MRSVCPGGPVQKREWRYKPLYKRRILYYNTDNWGMRFSPGLRLQTAYDFKLMTSAYHSARKLSAFLRFWEEKQC